MYIIVNVKCRTCGNEVDKKIAISYMIGKANRYFCSKEHFNEYIEKENQKKIEEEKKAEEIRIKKEEAKAKKKIKEEKRAEKARIKKEELEAKKKAQEEKKSEEEAKQKIYEIIKNIIDEEMTSFVINKINSKLNMLNEFTNKDIYSYLYNEEDYLYNILKKKNVSTISGKIGYVFAIVKSKAKHVNHEIKQSIKEVEYEDNVCKYKRKKQRVPMVDFENGA